MKPRLFGAFSFVEVYLRWGATDGASLGEEGIEGFPFILPLLIGVVGILTDIAEKAGFFMLP